MDRKPLTGPGESLLARWSRRKRGLGEGAGPQLPEAVEGVQSQDETAPDVVLTDADMPPIDSLDEDDDYSGFLSEGVSEALRQTALRRLFRSAKFNMTDGLDDYAEDFTAFAPLGDIVTADMKHRMQQLAAKVLAEDEDDGAGHTMLAASDDRPAEVAPSQAVKETAMETEEGDEPEEAAGR